MTEILLNGVLLKLKEIKFSENQSTLIFLHDSLGCIELWRDFPERLGKLSNCNVLIYDREGYSKSEAFTHSKRKNDYLEKEADVLNHLIEELKLKDVILFGHSDGGSIALLAAAKYPSHIKAVITEGAHIFVEEITLQGIKTAVKTYQTTNLKEKLQKYHGTKTEAVFQAWTDTWLQPEFKSWNIEKFLIKIKCPVLVIQGEEDEFGSVEQVNGIVSKVPGKASKLIIPAVGHTPHKEVADVVLAESVSFINSLL